MDIAVGQCATDSELLNGIIRLFVFLNRHGPAFQHFQCKIDKESFRLEIVKEIEYDPDDDGSKKRKGSKGGGIAHLPDDIEE